MAHEAVAIRVLRKRSRADRWLSGLIATAHCSPVVSNDPQLSSLLEAADQPSSTIMNSPKNHDTERDRS